MKTILMTMLVVAGTTSVYSSEVRATADATIDCSVDENGPSSTDEIEIFVPVAAPVSYSVDATGCDWVCGGGDSTVVTLCGSANFVGGAPVTATFTGYGWFEAYLPATYVTKRLYVVPDPSDVQFSVEAGDRSATFSWNSFDEAYSYVVTTENYLYNCDVAEGAAGVKSCTISGLTPGRAYEFTLDIDFNDPTGGSYEYGPLTVTPEASTTTTVLDTTTTGPTSTSSSLVTDDSLANSGSSSSAAMWMAILLIALGAGTIATRRR